MKRYPFIPMRSHNLLILMWVAVGLVIAFSRGGDATSCLVSDVSPHFQEEDLDVLGPYQSFLAYPGWCYRAPKGDDLEGLLAVNDPVFGPKKMSTRSLPQGHFADNSRRSMMESDSPLVDVPEQGATELGEMARPYHPIIMEASRQNQVDPALVKAIIMAESAYDPQAVSSEGAKGLMQLMPKTAEALGVKDAFNVKSNVNGGVRYLKQLLVEFDQDIELALAAYNAGIGMVRRCQGIPPIKQTRSYVEKVVSYYYLYRKEAAQAGYVSS